jgi:cell division septal protein FtsQ
MRKLSKRLQRLTLFVCATALLLSLGFVYSRNSLFRLSDITVECDDVEVGDWVKRRLVGQLGVSLFSVPLAAMERELMQLQRIDRVTLYRRWPSSVLIRVEVRRPVAVSFHNGRLWAVDNRGVLIHEVVQPLDRPLLSGFESMADDKLKAQRLEDLPGKVFAWLDSLEQRDNQVLDRSDFDEFAFDRVRGLIAKSFEKKMVVELGSDSFSKAWRSAEKSVNFLRSQGINASHLDATYANRVVVKTRPRLQNSEYRLNLEELVRRKEPIPGAAR